MRQQQSIAPNPGRQLRAWLIVRGDLAGAYHGGMRYRLRMLLIVLTLGRLH